MPFKNEFDIAIMLCEGVFPLMETDEMNFEIFGATLGAFSRNDKLTTEGFVMLVIAEK